MASAGGGDSYTFLDNLGGSTETNGIGGRDFLQELSSSDEQLRNALALLQQPRTLASAPPQHRQLQQLTAEDEAEYSPFSQFSVSPPLSPLTPSTSPPASPMPAHFKAVHSSGADIASTETFSSSPRHSPFVSGATTVAGQALGARGRRGSKRGLAKGDMDEPSLALRRRKHNELEIKRRKRLNDRYEELHQHLGCAHTRLAILETAIARLKHAESQIKALNIVLDAVKKHPGNLFVGTRNPKSESSSCQAPTASSTTARMLAAFDCVDVPLLVLLPNGSVADCSQSFCELIGFTKDVLRQSTIFSLASESDLSELYGVINKLVSKEISSHFLDLQLTHEEGKPVSFKCLICVDADKTTGKVCSMFLFGQASPIFSHQSTN